MSRVRARVCAVAAVAALTAVVVPVVRAQPRPELNVPGLEAAIAAGELTVTPAAPRPPSVKVVDGDVSDWIGERVGIAGSTSRSAGELIYEDFVFDAHGADDGIDGLVDSVAEPLVDLVPELDRALRAGPMMAGILLNGYVPDARPMHFGDAATPPGRRESADLVEARIAAGDGGIYLLARTGQMHSDDDTAVVLLVDVDDTPATRGVPFGTGLTTRRADLAVYVANTGSHVVDLRDGSETPLADVAVDSAGFTNAIEAHVPLPDVDGSVAFALVTGYASAAGHLVGGVGPDGTSDVVNVAFRSEDVTVAMDRAQAFMLGRGRIDETFVSVDLAELAGGATDTVVPGPGYYEASFVSTTPGVADESLPRQGAFQAYALHLPPSWTPGAPAPTTLWLHYGGGDTHHLGAFMAGLVRELGDARDNVLIGPSGRGAYSFYRGAGYADVMEVLADSLRFGRDVDRTAVAGYSMGSYGSIMLASLHPDLFAGALGMDGTPPSGFDGWTANRANAAAIPWVMMSGLSYPDMKADYDALVAAGAQARLYLYPMEHQANVILDAWSELTSALGQPVRDRTPERVRYTRVPAIEAGVATMPDTSPMVRTNPATVDVDADGAFWVDGIQLRDADVGRASVDATTGGHGHRPTRRVAESGLLSIGAAVPFAMEGVRYVPRGEATAPTATFEASLTNVSSVRLDMAGMGLCHGSESTGTVHTDGATSVTFERPGQTPVVVDLPGPGDHAVAVTC